MASKDGAVINVRRSAKKLIKEVKKIYAIATTEPINREKMTDSLRHE
ncbi:MAG: hypothetical protein ACJA0G_001473 [Kangiellaceae bacterium]|jgi:hypothetical protein